MTQYFVGKGRFGTVLGKFEDSDEPTEIYEINARGCTCPARVKNCKHQKIKRSWEARGAPLGAVYSDSGEYQGIWMKPWLKEIQEKTL